MATPSIIITSQNNKNGDNYTHMLNTYCDNSLVILCDE
jgi:hypothetical protein